MHKCEGKIQFKSSLWQCLTTIKGNCTSFHVYEELCIFALICLKKAILAGTAKKEVKDLKSAHLYESVCRSTTILPDFTEMISQISSAPRAMTVHEFCTKGAQPEVKPILTAACYLTRAPALYGELRALLTQYQGRKI
mgnify:CR=1 FL=1